MLRTAIQHIANTTSSSMAPKLASRVLGPVAMAASARYANSACKYWVSAKANAKNMKSAKDAKPGDENFVADHAFDRNEDIVKAAHLFEEAAHNKPHRASFDLTQEEPTKEELAAHNEYVRDHTFDVNKDAKKTK